MFLRFHLYSCTLLINIKNRVFGIWSVKKALHIPIKNNKYKKIILRWCTYQRNSGWDYLVSLQWSLWFGFFCRVCICFTHRPSQRKITFEQSGRKKKSNERFHKIVKVHLTNMLLYHHKHCFQLTENLRKNKNLLLLKCTAYYMYMCNQGLESQCPKK